MCVCVSQSTALYTNIKQGQGSQLFEIHPPSLPQTPRNQRKLTLEILRHAKVHSILKSVLSMWVYMDVMLSECVCLCMLGGQGVMNGEKKYTECVCVGPIHFVCLDSDDSHPVCVYLCVWKLASC